MLLSGAEVTGGWDCQVKVKYLTSCHLQLAMMEQHMLLVAGPTLLGLLSC
jgi:hypothetical protein